MNLSEAVQALKDGKKVRLRGWGKKSYIKMVGNVDPEIKFYNEATNHFAYDSKTLLSEEWYSIDYPDRKYNFPEMLSKLRQGKSCRREGWAEDMYIVYDTQIRNIVVKQMEEIPNFNINFDSLILENWEVVGEGNDHDAELQKNS